MQQRLRALLPGLQSPLAHAQIASAALLGPHALLEAVSYQCNSLSASSCPTDATPGVAQFRDNCTCSTIRHSSFVSRRSNSSCSIHVSCRGSSSCCSSIRSFASAALPRPEVGSLFTGVVEHVEPAQGAIVVADDGRAGAINIADTSYQFVDDAGKIFKVGDRVTALVIPPRTLGKLFRPELPQLSTRRLEMQPGLMHRDPAAVYMSAPEALRHIQEGRAFVQGQAHTAADVADLQEGDLIEGSCQAVNQLGVFVDFHVAVNRKPVSGLIRFKEVSHVRQPLWNDLIQPGDPLKAIVISVDRETGKVKLSIKALEMDPGLFLRNRQAVWDNADRAATKYRQNLQRKQQRPSSYEF